MPDDLRKGGLLGVVCDLPYRFVIPLPVRASEVLDLSEAELQALDKARMIAHDLTAEEVGQALVVKERHPWTLCERLLLPGHSKGSSWHPAHGRRLAAQGCCGTRNAGARRPLGGRRA
ncbi:MAG: hypothetical protein OXI81_00275 [Paracoccaceae bacterium]|nr:hypothetical protein [Paracoccaceae bacterium]